MTHRVAVVIPSFKVRAHVMDVIARMPPQVRRIYVVDDKCPQQSGQFVQEQCTDPRVRVIFHEQNQGVGGAVRTGYRAALEEGMDIVVKVDGDGQMNPALIPHFTRPIARGKADYTKGNRFYRPESLKGMPPIRLFGNAALSFVNKLSTGYWSIMDPTNGYTAIHTAVLRELPLHKLEQRYFFETDMLYHLNTMRAVVHDVPMDSVYADEESSLKVSKVLPEFMVKHVNRFFKRFVYLYLLRDFNLGSLYSLLGLLLCALGVLFGGWQWLRSSMTGLPATSGTVMLAALPLIIGIQFLIAFLHHDVERVPTEPLSLDLADLDDDDAPLPPAA
ncbi:glycosyltransferase family 2 protein [Ottowia sp.]|uniref:glycosyltransferase family 2 protein n=1 Tax=Ottowia sp. TaxID=1898956 RepID=UPI002CE248BC|nr:glycosyltransferase family 2 protein [Ottowia sp.]HOB66123.1 glycosyltransferase family 2 protein [Ottowia sp.]HPZ57160.1 glycosyltransferase family 2 protein [Ottowia sp.]HQD47136.1 glycosyltransferase family 2 protein [Ottowia sp.]